jgi:hypothetical protein
MQKQLRQAILPGILIDRGRAMKQIVLRQPSPLRLAGFLLGSVILGVLSWALLAVSLALGRTTPMTVSLRWILALLGLVIALSLWHLLLALLMRRYSALSVVALLRSVALASAPLLLSVPLLAGIYLSDEMYHQLSYDPDARLVALYLPLGLAVLAQAGAALWATRLFVPVVSRLPGGLAGLPLDRAGIQSVEVSIRSIDWKQGWRRATRKLLLWVVLLGPVAAVVAAMAYAYVSSERYFYFWDYGAYQGRMVDQLARLQEGSQRPLLVALGSMGSDYNLLFTLPLIPVMLLIGDPFSRATFIVSLALVYMLPFMLVTGLICRRALPTHPTAVFWLAVVISILTPAAWLPIWRGHPDTGGAVFIGLAIFAYLYDPKLQKWWQIPLIGVALVAAPLLRRHFAYETIAFMFSLAVMAFGEFLRDQSAGRPGAGRTLMKQGLRIGMAVAVSLVILLTFARPFLDLVVAKNAELLYTSWQKAPLDVWNDFRAYYGLLGLALAAAGLAVGSLLVAQARRPLAFLALFWIANWGLWLFVVRQTNLQYTLHFTLPFLVGIAVLAWLGWARLAGARRLIALSLLGAFLSVNAIAGVAPHLLPPFPGAGALFAGRAEPLVRTDYTEVVSLVDTLHALAGDREAVAVVASSLTLNYDLLVAADRAGHPGRPLNLIFVPEIDTRDQYPMESLLQADFVVLGRPLQTHLAASEHGVLRAAYLAFDEQWEISQSFVRLPEAFSLRDGVSVDLYRRIGETSPDVAVRTLARMQQEVGARSSHQRDWLSLDGGASTVSQLDRTHYALRTSLPGGPDAKGVFLYLGDVPAQGHVAGNWRISGEACTSISIELAAADEDGTTAPIATAALDPANGGDFSIPFSSSEGAPYLLLTITHVGPAVEGCEVTVDGLRVD